MIGLNLEGSPENMAVKEKQKAISVGT